MYMNLFNELNCRKVGEKEFNIFTNILSNMYYLIIVPVEFFVVYYMTNTNELIFSILVIDSEQQWIAFILGFLSLAVGAGLKYVPTESVKHYFEDIPEDMAHERLEKIKKLVDTVDNSWERSETMQGFDKDDFAK